VNAVSERREAGNLHDDPGIARDEAVAPIGSDNKVEVAGLASALSDGIYSYSIGSPLHAGVQHVRSPLEKHGRSIKLSVPSDGLFDVRIYDRLNTPRIDLLLVALRQPRAARVSKSYQAVEVLLKDWNEDYQGWPIHEFRRAYLRSVMFGIASAAPPQTAIYSLPKSQAADVACEPQFKPDPGVFKNDTEVVLLCDTPGATIRYTVDGSQPLEGATTYGAPIIVKGTALTIKAYASAEGKRDSPVVTGIFRIAD